MFTHAAHGQFNEQLEGKDGREDQVGQGQGRGAPGGDTVPTQHKTWTLYYLV